VNDVRPPAGADAKVPSPARVYDYLLGGKDNYEIDRMVGDRLLSVAPDTRLVARANRAFLKRVVEYVSGQGVRQFIDLGTGIPTSPNVHEIARQVNPDAKVVYVDNDPLVKVHNDALLATDPGVITLEADIRDPAAVLDSAEVQGLIDFAEPIALLMITVLHFVSDEENPTGLIGAFYDLMVPGSFLAISHSSSLSDPETLKQLSMATAGTPAQSTFRSPAEIERMFAGFEILEPGVVRIQDWRPDLDYPDTKLNVQAAVGRKN
jgi:hypothetical protein